MNDVLNWKVLGYILKILSKIILLAIAPSFHDEIKESLEGLGHGLDISADFFIFFM